MQSKITKSYLLSHFASRSINYDWIIHSQTFFSFCSLAALFSHFNLISSRAKYSVTHTSIQRHNNIKPNPHP